MEFFLFLYLEKFLVALKKIVYCILALVFYFGCLGAATGCERTSPAKSKSAKEENINDIPAKAHIEEYYSGTVLGEFDAKVRREGEDAFVIPDFLSTGRDFKINIAPETGEISPMTCIVQWDEGTKSWEIGSDPMEVGTPGKKLEELWLYSGSRRSFYSFDTEKGMYRIRLCVMGYFDNGDEDYYSIIYYFNDDR